MEWSIGVEWSLGVSAGLYSDKAVEERCPRLICGQSLDLYNFSVYKC